MNATVNEYQSSPARRSLAGGLGFGALAPERLVLVVHRLVAAGAQDRLAQPLQAEDEQQRTHHQAKRVDRNLLQRRAERRDEHREHDGRGSRRRSASSASRAPSPTPSTIVSASTISTAQARKAPRPMRIVAVLTLTTW